MIQYRSTSPSLYETHIKKRTGHGRGQTGYLHESILHLFIPQNVEDWKKQKYTLKCFHTSVKSHSYFIYPNHLQVGADVMQGTCNKDTHFLQVLKTLHQLSSKRGKLFQVSQVPGKFHNQMPPLLSREVNRLQESKTRDPSHLNRAKSCCVWNCHRRQGNSVGQALYSLLTPYLEISY